MQGVDFFVAISTYGTQVAEQFLAYAFVSSMVKLKWETAPFAHMAFPIKSKLRKKSALNIRPMFPAKIILVVHAIAPIRLVISRHSLRNS